MPVQAGVTLELSAGPVTVMARLGRGSFGEVFHVRDGHGKDTALKLDKDRKALARNERARRQLKNEHVVYTALQKYRGFPHVYGMEEVRLNDGIHTGLNMQRLGPSLAQMQKKCPGGFIPEEHLIIVFRKALDRLRSMHRAGFVHRDIKPDNLMLGMNTDGELYVIDMGLAARFITVGNTYSPKTPPQRGNNGYR